MNKMDTGVRDVPLSIMQAALEVELYFKERLIIEWKLCGIQNRSDQPTFADALRIARGCVDHAGGHRHDGHLKAFRHGIQTVIYALEAAAKSGLNDPQVAALWKMGGEK